MRISRYLFMALFSYGLWILPAHSQGNPFLRQENPSTQETTKVSQPDQPDPTPPAAAPLRETNEGSLLRDLKSTFRTQQAFFQNQLAEKSQSLVTEGQTQLWFTLIITAFLYGAFHSLGPGHGKCVVCSYFTAEEADIKKGLLLGYLVSVIHALSALAIVSVVYFILQGSSQMVFNQATQYISMTGYGLIALLGLVLLGQRLRQGQQHIHTHDAHCHHTHCDHNPTQPARKSLWLAALAIGIIPCPGALTILLFSISLNTLSLGIILASMIALGMGLTISLLAVITVLSRQQAFKWLTKNPLSTGHTDIHAQRLEKYLGIGGALSTFLFGSVLFVLHWPA